MSQNAVVVVVVPTVRLKDEQPFRRLQYGFVDPPVGQESTDLLST
jgi:hypothetical protein